MPSLTGRSAATHAAGEAHGGDGARVERRDAWTAELPAHGRLSIREWRPGDRMRLDEGGAARRVKRFLADARVPGPDRAGWPVVLLDSEIVWIPGVRRSRAAADRSGRPTVRYICERFDGGLPDN
jgi:tRNA(Ile)-lysidine synthase